jgi:hypothetical protein
VPDTRGRTGGARTCANQSPCGQEAARTLSIVQQQLQLIVLVLLLLLVIVIV